MAVTQNSYVGNGSTTTYSFTFPYLKSTDVKAQIDATDTTAFTLPTATTLQFNTAPSNGAKIKIYRSTGDDSLTATFYAGSAIKSEDLNDNFTQNLYTTQEVNARYLSNLGGTMVGDLTMDEDADIVFEGATADAYETTLTVVDPTADRTVSLPNETGTLVTNNSTNYVTSAHIVDGAVATVDLAADAVTGAKIADDAVDSEHIAADSIDAEHYAPGSVDATALASNAVTTAKINADAVDGTKIADDAINSEHYVDGSIDTAHIADDQVTADKLANTAVTAGSYTAADITVDAQGSLTAAANGTIGTSEIAADAITSGLIADNAVGTEHIADAELTTLAGMQAGTASVLAGGTALAATLTEINTVCDGKGVHTTISDSDAHYPTSGAVVDYVSTQLASVGGFETITTDAAFPNTQPASGIIVSIADAGGLVVNGSGVSTTGRTAGGSTVTINGINAQFYSTTVAAGVAMMVESTGSGHIYNYHKATLKEADLINLSTDIQDFGNRYRTAANRTSDGDSSNDDGDLFYDQTANKMFVHDGSTWGEVASTGEFKYLFLCPAGGTGAPTINGSVATYDLREGSNSGSVADVSVAAQLLVSIDGVIQKANTGTSAPAEGFALVDTNTIIFGSNLASGSSVFIVQIGSSVTVPTPADNSVTTAKINTAAVTGAKIADDTITEAKLDIHAAPTGTDKFLKYTSNGMEWVVPSYTTNTNTQLTEEQVEDFVGGMVTGNTETGITVTYEDGDGTLDFVTEVTLAGAETFTGVKTFNAAAIGEVTALSDGATIATDLALSNNFSVTLAGNRTLGQPTNQVAGQSGSFFVTQDGTGSRTLAYHADFKWVGGTAPTLSTAANAVDRIDYVVAAANKIHAVASLDVK